MNAAEPFETRTLEDPGFSINILAPCNNQIFSGDHIEVHIHIDGQGKQSTSADDGVSASGKSSLRERVLA